MIDSLWQKNPRRNLWQHPLWQKFQEAIGRHTSVLEVSGARALIIKRTMPFGLNWLEVPRGPLFENQKGLSDIMEAVKKFGENEKSVFVRFSCYDPAIEDFPLKKRDYDNHPQTSLVLDLTLSEEELLNQMKPKGRYNIKVAQKHNVVVRPGTVEEFYAILKGTAERDGFKLHSQAYYQTMMEVMGEHAHLLMAEYEGRPVAGGIFIYLDEWAIYYYGASDHHYRNIMAPYLVQWEAMLEGRRRGCHYYDFLGIAPEGVLHHRWAGVTDFKKKFGGMIKEYPQARELVLRPFLYFLYRIYKRLR